MLISLDPSNTLRRLGTIRVVAPSIFQANSRHLCHSEWSKSHSCAGQGAWVRASQELPFAMMWSLQRKASPPQRRNVSWLRSCATKIQRTGVNPIWKTPKSSKNLYLQQVTPLTQISLAGSQRKVSKTQRLSRVSWKQLKQTAREWSVVFFLNAHSLQNSIRVSMAGAGTPWTLMQQTGRWTQRGGLPVCCHLWEETYYSCWWQQWLSWDIPSPGVPAFHNSCPCL